MHIAGAALSHVLFESLCVALMYYSISRLSEMSLQDVFCFFVLHLEIELLFLLLLGCGYDPTPALFTRELCLILPSS